MQSKFEPACGMWIIQGTVTRKTGDGKISSQFATFYLHPEVQGCNSIESAVAVATGILNPTNDPNITPHVSANLISVEVYREDGWSTDQLKAMDPNCYEMS